MADYRDFYILWVGHPNYNSDEIIVSDDISVITQKIELCLFTNQGECAGDINFGCNLVQLLWQTSVSTDYIKSTILNQFATYIPELINYNYTVNVTISEGSLQDILIVDITISDTTALRAVFR